MRDVQNGRVGSGGRMLNAGGAAELLRDRTQPMPLARARLGAGSGSGGVVVQPLASFQCPAVVRRFTLCPLVPRPKARGARRSGVRLWRDGHLVPPSLLLLLTKKHPGARVACDRASASQTIGLGAISALRGDRPAGCRRARARNAGLRPPREGDAVDGFWRDRAGALSLHGNRPGAVFDRAPWERSPELSSATRIQSAGEGSNLRPWVSVKERSRW